MSKEVFNSGERLMTPEQQDEQFYVPVSLDENDIFCGDDRASSLRKYIHLLGGGANPMYTYMVLQETLLPDSVKDSFEDTIRSGIPTLITAAHVHPGVHSDTHTEQADHIQLNLESEATGCGYLQKRAAISMGIQEGAHEIVTRGQQLLPELFRSDEDIHFAYATTEAHGRLATRAGFLPAGRRLMKAAIESGAKDMVVIGEHVGHKAKINRDENTSYNSTAALQRGNPMYDHDAWAAHEIAKRQQDLYPCDLNQYDIANAIDAIGTFLALGVKIEDISVRRPAQPRESVVV